MPAPVVTIEKIQETEKTSDGLVRQQKAMEKGFMADGEIDANERKQLNSLSSKIKQVREVVAKLRKELEQNKADFEKRGSDYAKLKAQLDELKTWGHKAVKAVSEAVDAIAPLPGAQRWKEASEELQAALKVIAEPWKDYQIQSAAKDVYTPLRTELDSRIAAARLAEPPAPAILKAIDAVVSNLGAIDAHVGNLDYVEALALVKAALTQVQALEDAIRKIQDQKGIYDLEWDALRPRLDEVRVCEFPDLTPMQEELLALADQIEAAGNAYDYVTAFPMLDDASVKIDTYMKAYAAAVSARDQYEARLPGIKKQLAAMVCQYPALADREVEIAGIADAMEKAAAGGNHEAAMVEMDKLPALLDAHRAAVETERLREEFEALRASLETRLSKLSVCNYGPLTALSEEILNDVYKAEQAAASKDYTEAMNILNLAIPKIDRYEQALALQEAAEQVYGARSAKILDRYDAIAKCEYPQLDDAQIKVIALHDKMLACEGERDFVCAVEAMEELEVEIDAIEITLADLDAKKLEYETRLPALIQRFDSSMQCDFVELEDERKTLETTRAEMEKAATGRDYPLALDKLNAVERLLNELDAQLDDLTRIKAQYEALLETLKPLLAAVEACKHEQLAPKKAEILALRDAMLAAASATDFSTALEKANALVKPLDEFAKLEEALAKYLEAYGAVKADLVKVRAFTYKSLKTDKDAAEKLFTAMEAAAKALDFTLAMSKMDELKSLLAKIIARNDTLKLQEAVYQKLASKLAPKVEIVKKNTIKEAEAKMKAVVTANDAMLKLAESHEYEKAVEAADKLEGLIDAFEAKVAEFGGDRAAYELMRDMVEPDYQAAGKAKDQYKDLEKPYEALATPHKAMEAAAKAETYKEALEQAKALKAALKEFDAKVIELLKREEKLKAEADTAIGRFKALPKDAKDKGGDFYEDAATCVERITEALKEKDFDRAEENIGKLNEALTGIDDALKTEDQLKAEYDERLKSLQRDAEKARGSEVAKKLETELKAVNEAFSAMEAEAADGDYKAAKKKADEVQKALDAFSKAETPLLLDSVRFAERMEGLEPAYKRALDREEMFLKLQIAEIQSLHKVAEKQGQDHDYKAGLETAAQLREKIDKILDTAEVYDDKCREAEGKKSIAEELLDKAKDFVIDEGLEFIEDKTGLPVKTGYETAKSGYDTARKAMDAGEKLLDGNYDGAWDAAKDAGDSAWDTAKGAAKMSPAGKAYEKAMDAVEDAKKVYDVLNDVVSDD